MLINAVHQCFTIAMAFTAFSNANTQLLDDGFIGGSGERMLLKI